MKAELSLKLYFLIGKWHFNSFLYRDNKLPFDGSNFTDWYTDVLTLDPDPSPSSWTCHFYSRPSQPTNQT
ncbi:hypothetical protein AB6E53_06675 [Vibrio breoganii]